LQTGCSSWENIEMARSSGYCIRESIREKTSCFSAGLASVYMLQLRSIRTSPKGLPS
jgi:hypothetical protein